MDFSPSAPTEKLPAAIESLQHWWSLAGVDLRYDEEPGALLGQSRAVNAPPKNARSVVEEEKPELLRETVAEEAAFPEDYQAFVDWLSNPENLLENRWSREFALPSGPTSPQVMVVTAMPEANGPDIYAGESMKLLKNMLRATGFDIDQSYFASLALARPVDGQLTVKHLEMFKRRTLHQIDLVKPGRMIFLGDTVSKAFFGQDLLTARKKKQFINHGSSKTEAIATFHPRILLQRPELKAEAWRDLQLILRTPAP